MENVEKTVASVLDVFLREQHALSLRYSPYITFTYAVAQPTCHDSALCTLYCIVAFHFLRYLRVLTAGSLTVHSHQLMRCTCISGMYTSELYYCTFYTTYTCTTVQLNMNIILLLLLLMLDPTQPIFSSRHIFF